MVSIITWGSFSTPRAARASFLIELAVIIVLVILGFIISDYIRKRR